VRRLANAGHLIALDDFGTGFNALEYFLRFPVNALKFDAGIISAMRTDDTAKVIVSGVARIAHELGVATLAEGIETEEDAQRCVDIGLAFGQGWHYGYPTSIDEFTKAVAASRLGVAAKQIDRPVFFSAPEDDTPIL